MIVVKSTVINTERLQGNIFLQKIRSPEIASLIKPGEFLNIKVSESTSPLLRRPFSVADVEDEFIYLIFNVVGEGTQLLSEKREGELLDVLGPLGRGFNLNDDFESAVLVVGGIGAAPFPFVTRMLENRKKIITFIGGRTSADVITYGMKNVFSATDDGSGGFKGTVVDLLLTKVNEYRSAYVKVFGCGPTPMLRALKEFCLEYDLNCEVSTECAMACGFGICQGCPIESTEQHDKYLLVCKDGPVFNIKDIVI